MSMLVDFYRGCAKHPYGYTIDEIWKWDDRKMERLHSYTQWLFPLAEASQMVANSPVAMKDDVEQFHSDPELRKAFMKSFHLMLAFYGFTFAADGRSIVKACDFEFRSGWLYPSNHNYRRITRILKSLRLMGFSDEAEMFFVALEGVYKTHYRYIGTTTLNYWSDAVGRKGVVKR